MTKVLFLALLLVAPALVVNAGESSTLLRNGAVRDEEGSSLTPPQGRRLQGEKFCGTGFIMDTFCIAREKLFDRPNLKTLEEPERHTVHCLVDVRQCITSGYEILGPKPPGSTEHTRVAKFDAAGNDMLLTYARSVGETSGPYRCTTCDGTGDVLEGLKATVVGVFTSEGSSFGPPMLAVEAVLPETTTCESLMPVEGGDEDPEGGDDEECAERPKDKFLFKKNKMKPCKFLKRKSDAKICKICEKYTADEVCCETCAICM